MSRTQISRVALAVAAFALLTASSLVTEATAAFLSRHGHFSVELPIGWVMDDFTGGVAVTRDGFKIQHIVAKRTEFRYAFQEVLAAAGEDAAGKDRRLGPEMGPEELAELKIADVKRNFENAEVLDNEPALIGGEPAYRLTFEFKDQRGLRLRLHTYGQVRPTGLVELSYMAPVLHYVDRDLPEFERMAETFRYVSAPKRR
jgi:hypothetical protein